MKTIYKCAAAVIIAVVFTVLTMVAGTDQDEITTSSYSGSMSTLSLNGIVEINEHELIYHPNKSELSRIEFLALAKMANHYSIWIVKL